MRELSLRIVALFIIAITTTASINAAPVTVEFSLNVDSYTVIDQWFGNRHNVVDNTPRIYDHSVIGETFFLTITYDLEQSGTKNSSQTILDQALSYQQVSGEETINTLYRSGYAGLIETDLMSDCENNSGCFFGDSSNTTSTETTSTNGSFDQQVLEFNVGRFELETDEISSWSELLIGSVFDFTVFSLWGDTITFDYYRTDIFGTTLVTGHSINGGERLSGTGTITNIINPNATVVPLPAAAWLFGGAVLWLVGFRKFKN